MRLSELKIKNFRLLVDVELNIDNDITLIVGRNNTAKTTCNTFIEMVMQGKQLSYDDYPLCQRKTLHDLISSFMANTISYSELCERIPVASIEFWVDYSIDDPNESLGALSPFIIDVDIDITMAIIRVEYKFKIEEQALREKMEPIFIKEGTLVSDSSDTYDGIKNLFSKMFDMTIYAVNPNKQENRQIKSLRELQDLFPYYVIPAERVLGEDGVQNNSSLTKLISSFFDADIEDLDISFSEQIKQLRESVGEANKNLQKQSDSLLSEIVNKAIGFGYPNGEELQLAVTTKLGIDEQIKNQTQLAYTTGIPNESLPSSYNGLGYKNLIKIEFLLAAYAKEIGQLGTACIPLLFIEEPESHMHPQMQQAFAKYLSCFLEKISDVHIQVIMTSHSAHISNTVDFSQIRYAQKTTEGVKYKDLRIFAKSNPDNVSFIKKYLTISRCDLFFADKVIMVEGASERLLIPDMIQKCDGQGAFDSQKYKLSAQYYSLIEVGGAYAHVFIPFIDFLDIPCLIITDLDPTYYRKAVPVSKGTATSNATIKWWVREAKRMSQNSKIKFSDVIGLSIDKKTRRNCHIEFQTNESGLCGRSLEEAIRNVNRQYFKLSQIKSDEQLAFSGKSKTDFALELISNCPDYTVPDYIRSGLIWLNDQKVL